VKNRVKWNVGHWQRKCPRQHVADEWAVGFCALLSRPFLSSINVYCRRQFWSAEGLATGSPARSLTEWFGRSVSCLYAPACVSSRALFHNLSLPVERGPGTYECSIIVMGIKPITYFYKCKIHRKCWGGNWEVMFYALDIFLPPI